MADNFLCVCILHMLVCVFVCMCMCVCMCVECRAKLSNRKRQQHPIKIVSCLEMMWLIFIRVVKRVCLLRCDCMAFRWEIISGHIKSDDSIMNNTAVMNCISISLAIWFGMETRNRMDSIASRVDRLLLCTCALRRIKSIRAPLCNLRYAIFTVHPSIHSSTDRPFHSAPRGAFATIRASCHDKL